MGDEEDGAGVVDEVVFHPGLGVDVEVVGGLVEEQAFGGLEEELGHGNTHLPAAGEVSAVAGEVALAEAETGEDGLDAGFHAGGVVGIEHDFEVADFFEAFAEGGGAGVEVLEAIGQFIDAFADGDGFGEGRFCFIPEGDAFDVDAFLGEVADAIALGHGDFAAAGLDDIADAFHQRGFSGTVVASEGDALFRLDGEGEVAKEDAGAVFDAEILNGEHGVVDQRFVLAEVRARLRKRGWRARTFCLILAVGGENVRS